MRTAVQEYAAANYLRPKDMAARLNCTAAHVNELIRTGVIAPAIDVAVPGKEKHRANYRVAPEVFEEYLARSIVQPEAA